MLKSSAAGKNFFALLLLFLASSCSIWRAGSENAQTQPTPAVADELKTEIPFSTKEPEIYQTLAVSKIFSETGGETERRIFTARNGARRLTIFNSGEKGENVREVSQLELESNQIFLIYSAKKIYAEISAGSALAVETAGSDLFDSSLLNQKTPATFENLGTENNLTKYRVRLGESERTNSEVLVYVDENLKIPVRQEFYNMQGEQKILTFSVELKDFKNETDEKFFELPKDYKKVSPEEFQKILWGEPSIK